MEGRKGKTTHTKMEDVTITVNEFGNTLAAVNTYVKGLSEIYRDLLIRDDKRSSGNLIRSIQPVKSEMEGSRITGAMSLASYWKYVENGRRAGKWPPYDAILKWVTEKPVIPRAGKGGRIPTEKQLAFLIQRKIGLEGIKPGNQLSEAQRLAWPRYESVIQEAVGKDLNTFIDRLTVI